MTKIIINSTDSKSEVIERISLCASKLESASREANMLIIPSSFRYYSYLSQLRSVLFEHSKSCELSISALNGQIAKWEDTKNRILNDCNKLDIPIVKPRNKIIK
jgi:hypothetical protein